MTEVRLPSKFAFILHADVVGSTMLVRQDEQIAHNRIQSAFSRLSETIAVYGGFAREVRGDALVAEFERASAAVAAALAFQVANTEYNKGLTDSIRPELRVGVGMGEGVIADDTVTGTGVVLAQRLEQLAEPGGVVIQGATYETIPKRMPFVYQSLGEQEVKGFDEPVRAYSVNLEPGKEIPQPEPAVVQVTQKGVSWFTFAIGAVVIVFVTIALGWFSGWFPATISPSSDQSGTRLKNKPIDRATAIQGLQTVKAGRLNLKLKIPNRWDAQVVETGLANFIDKNYKPGVQEIILTDREGKMNVEIFKWYHPNALDSGVMHNWVQGEGVRRILVEYLVGKSYKESDRNIIKGNLGSGEEMTVISLTLQVDNETRYARIAYVIRGKSYTREFIVFFFHNEKGIHEISDDDLASITGSATLMFDSM